MDAFIIAVLGTGTNLLGFLLLARSNASTIRQLFAANREVSADSATSAEKRIIVLETKIHFMESQMAHTQETVHNLMFVFTAHPKELPKNRGASKPEEAKTTIG